MALALSLGVAGRATADETGGIRSEYRLGLAALGRGWKRSVLAALVWGLWASRALAAEGPDWGLWGRALEGVAPASLVRFPEAGGLAVETALVTSAEPRALLGVLAEPGAFCRAVPSLVRCEGGPSEAVKDGAGRWRRMVDWELEIPLANLSGRLAIEPEADWMGVTLRFASGDLAPGTLHFRWTPATGASAAAPRTLLWASLAANVRDANWLLRRLARRDPWTEPAIRGAIVWIASQALAALAAHPSASEGPRPTGALGRTSAPSSRKGASARGTSAFGDLLAPTGVGTAKSTTADAWAAVENAGSGRLAQVEVTRRWPLAEAEALRRVATSSVLGAFTGWSHVTTVSSQSDHADIDVRDELPFVDFDARWRLSFGRQLEARAIAGAVTDAWWTWSARADVAPTGQQSSSVVIFSSYPRLERSGWAPRRFIEAEPFLEHGLALALAYVDIMAAERAALSGKPLP